MTEKQTQSLNVSTAEKSQQSPAAVENEKPTSFIDESGREVLICDTCGKPWGSLIQDVYTKKYRHISCMSGIIVEDTRQFKV